MTEVVKQLRKKAGKLAGKALEKLLADEASAARVAAAFGAVQQGKARLEAAQQAGLHAAGWATRQDFRELGRRLSALRRRTEKLLEKADARFR